MSKTLEQLELKGNNIVDELFKDGYSPSEIAVTAFIITNKIHVVMAVMEAKK